MFVRKKTVDTIVQGVAKVITDLEALAEVEAKKREEKKAKAESLAAEASSHDTESSRAKKMSGNFKKLLEI